MIFAEKILEHLRETGLTRKEFAEMADIPLSTLNSIINGSNPNPTILTVIKVAQAANISIDGIAGLTSKGMGREEVDRVQAEHLKYKEELDRKLAEHSQEIRFYEAENASLQELIRRQDLRMAEQNKTIAGLEDRIRYQKKAIFIHRVIMVALFLLWITTDLACPNNGLFRQEFLDLLASLF